MTIKPPFFGLIAWPSLGLVVAFLGLAILANAFAAFYITQEHYVYAWDWGGYWMTYLSFSEQLMHDPVNALHWLVISIWNDDYKLLPVLPLVPFEWLFGPSRLTYILAITNIALLPGVLVMGLLAQRILQTKSPKRSLSLLVLTSASILALHSIWSPVLRGLPDVIGIVAIGGTLLLHFAKPLEEQRLNNLVWTGLLLCLLVLLRRWYAFWVIAFFPALAVAHGLNIYQRHGIGWQHYMTITRNTVIIGLTFILALFTISAPFALRAIRTDYSDIYSAWRASTSLLEAAKLLPRDFGWIVIIGGLAGLAWLTVRKETRVVGSFLISQLLIVFVLFARTQDFGVQHHYLLVPGIALGIAVVVGSFWAQIKNDMWRAASVGFVFTVLLANSAAAFFPGAARVADILGSLVPQARYYPLIRNDLAVLERLLNRLDKLELDQRGDIYILASSQLLNSNVMYSACQFGPQRRFICDRILNTNDVDKRDGFPRQFLHAHYLVVASPTQYHQRAKDQRVIGVLAREVMEGHGVGASFHRLPVEFKLDKGVTAWVFEKIRPFERTDLDALADEFIGYYPDKRDIFKTAD